MMARDTKKKPELPPSVAESARPALGGALTAAQKEEVHKRAMRRADEAWLAERDNYREGRDCQKFYAGDQWDPTARQTREKDGRPVLTINRLPQFNRQMTGDLRKNPPGLKFMPARGGATVDTAEAYSGIARHIEQQSNGKDCYIIATENASIASQGFFRVVTQYSGDDTFDLDIRIKPIRDPFGALIDPFASLPDKSDMRYGFVFEHLGVEDFKAEWPDMSADEIMVPKTDSTSFPWRVNDTIRIAEYWEKQTVKKTIHLLVDGKIVEQVPAGMQPVKSREVEASEVVMYLITGKDVLSGPHPFPCRYIPICAVVGEEITLDGVTVRKGMVHDARDPQRIYNYSRTASVEAVAMQPKAPFVGTFAHFKGQTKLWATAGSKNHAYLTYNIDPNAPNSKPERAQPPIASTGLDTQALIASEDMKAVTGIHDASLGAKSNETSGIAIQRRQQEGDTATYLYPDNLGRAIGYLGRILADMIPRVYDQERQVRILKEDGTVEMVTVNAKQPAVNENGKPMPLYDLGAGEYDVVPVMGPSFATRRAEASAHMVELVRAVPGIAQIAGDIIIRNMDFPGAEEVAKRLEKINPAAQDEPAPPNPAEQAEVAKSAASAAKDAALTDKTVAETTGINLNNAQTAMQLQTLGMALPQIMQELQALRQMVGGSGGQPQPAPQGEAPPSDMSGTEEPPAMDVPQQMLAPQESPLVEVGPL